MARPPKPPRPPAEVDRRFEHIERQLFRIEHLLKRLVRYERKEDQEMADIQAALAKLTATVQKDTDVTTSAVTAIQGMNQVIQDLRQQVADLIANGGDVAAIEAAINAAADASDANTTALAAAIPANT